MKIARKTFTLIEDQLILENLVIPRLRNKKLRDVILGRPCCQELADQWRINTMGLSNRWTNTLQPTLLQHYTGTLNFRVERMLANHISENWSDIAQINWIEVAGKSEFVGHTENSLRNLYMILSGNLRRISGLPNSEVTTQNISQYTEQAYGEGGKGGKIGMKKMQRKKDVIAFFEDKMMELNIENFL